MCNVEPVRAGSLLPLIFSSIHIWTGNTYILHTCEHTGRHAYRRDGEQCNAVINGTSNPLQTNILNYNSELSLSV